MIAPVDWNIAPAPVAYEAAVAAMETRVAAIRAGTAGEQVWLVEHPPLYTAGTGAQAADLLDARFPVHRTGRGGQFTYHGPGQRVAYVMLDLRRRGPDVRAFVCALEDWIIATLKGFGVEGERRDGRVGVWVRRPGRTEAKIAAVGVRVRHWITYHGIALNLRPDLTHYAGIVPCGIRDAGVTSLHDLGVDVLMDEVDAALRHTFSTVFEGAGEDLAYATTFGRFATAD